MPKLWDLYAHTYDAITALRPYGEMLDEVVGALDVAPGLRVLDAGCGTGALAERLAKACPDIEYVGVDLSPSMLARARARRTWPRGFTFLQGDFDALLSERRRRVRPRGERQRHLDAARSPRQPRAHDGRLAAGRSHGAHDAALALPRGRGRVATLASADGVGAAARLARVADPSSSRPAQPASRRAKRAPWGRAAGHGGAGARRGSLSLLREAGAEPRPVRPCYAGQGYLLVAGKAGAGHGTGHDHGHDHGHDK